MKYKQPPYIRVTEENFVIETVQSGPYSSFECSSALKGTHIYILFFATVASDPMTAYVVACVNFTKPKLLGFDI